MKFYDRKNELKLLKKTSILKNITGAQLTVLTGRRRVGKSTLMFEFLKTQKRFLYFFVSRKKSHLLLNEFTTQLHQVSGQLGSFVNWDDFFTALFDYALQTKTLLIFDEFQNFTYVDKAIFDIFQKNWDRCHQKKGLAIYVAGSLIRTP